MECMYYEKWKTIYKMSLCPHRCIIKDGNTGICRVRKNVRGP